MRRRSKILAWTAVALVAVVGAALLALLVAGNTDAGRRLMERTVYRLTSGNVRLAGLSGSFPSHLLLDKLELVDDRGVWLTAEKIDLVWTPLAYLGGRLQIDDLHVMRLGMERLPHSTSKNATEPKIPRIDASRIDIDALDLGAQLAGVAASLTAHGSAHLRTVSDMLFDASIKRVGGDGSYELHLQFDTERMNASLQIQEPANGPLENILGLPGLGALTASANLNGLRSAERVDLVLQAGALRGKANGTFSLADASADLEFAFDSQAMTPRPDIHWNRASLQGRWQGSFKAPRAQGRLQIAGLTLPGGTKLGSFDADMHADSGKAALQATVRELIIPGPDANLLANDPIKLDASVQLDDAKYPAELVASQKLFSLRAKVDAGGERRVTLDLKLPDLQPFARAIPSSQLDIRGNADVKVDFLGDANAGHVRIDAKANLMPGSQSWAAAIGNAAVLHLAAAYQERRFTLDDFKLSGDAVTATAAGTWASDNSRLRFDLEFPNLRALSPVLSGSLKSSGTLFGPAISLGVDAQATASVSVRGTPTGALKADFKARGLPSNPSGSLELGGVLDDAPLHLNVDLQRGEAGSLRVRVRDAAWKSAHADGDLTVAKNSGESHGQLRFSMAQLSDLQHLSGTDLSGSLTAALGLRSEHQRNLAQLQIDAHDVAIAQLKGDLHLNGEGSTDAFSFKSDIALPNWRDAPAKVTAAGSLNLDGSELSLNSLSAAYRGQEAHLVGPARIVYRDGLSVDNLRVGMGQAEAQVQGRVLPELAIRASVSRLQPAIINLFVPDLLASGSIEAHADLHGTVSAPTGQLSVTASGVRMADDAALGLPPVNVRLDAGLTGASANLDANLDAGSATQLKAFGRMPLDPSGVIDMKLGGTLDVGLINPFLEARGQHAGGKLTVDAVVGGNFGAPQIGGRIELTDGSLRDYGRGVSLQDIAAQIVGSQGTLQIKSLTATAAPGKVTMSGSVGILQAGIPVDVTLVAANAQPIASKLVTANLDAKLRVVGKATERLDVSGSMHLNRTLIGIPNGLPPNVAVLDVHRRGKLSVATASKPLVVGLDIAVQAPNQILVQGRGLDAEMGGDLHIGGTIDEPQVSGGFDLQRGSFSLASSKLNFTEGRVGFNGAGVKARIDPTLDFTAQTTVGDATATLRITGVADSPVFEFSSSPVLPQDEIMARLLFGENAAQLSGLQLAQIGAALATLSGVGGNGGGLNPLVKIQRSLGLDRLNVGSGTVNTPTGPANAGASIEAGRYISKRVYIGAKQSTQGTSQLEADVELTKHLKLQTKLGNGTASVQGTTPENDPGSSIGLSYQFEY